MHARKKRGSNYSLTNSSHVDTNPKSDMIKTQNVVDALGRWASMSTIRFDLCLGGSHRRLLLLTTGWLFFNQIDSFETRSLLSNSVINNNCIFLQLRLLDWNKEVKTFRQLKWNENRIFKVWLWSVNQADLSCWIELESGVQTGPFIQLNSPSPDNLKLTPRVITDETGTHKAVCDV